MDRRANVLGDSLPAPRSPTASRSANALPRQRKLQMKTNTSGSCSIASLFYLLLGFQLAWILVAMSQRGSSWQELKEIERRLGDRIDIVAAEREMIGVGADGGRGNETDRGVGKNEGVAWDLGMEKESSRRFLKGGEDAGDENPDPANVGEINCTSLAYTERKKGTVAWVPQANKYLLALCSGGQLSNRLACIRQNMLDASLMNRTLVLPTHGLDYNYSNLLDLDAVQDCFPSRPLISLDEYIRTVDSRVRVGRFICHVHTYQTDKICAQLAQTLSSKLNLMITKHEIVKRRTPGPWFKYPVKDFLQKFNSDHHLLAFANMFGVGGRGLKFEGSAPLVVGENCTGILQPSQAIQETAAGFVNTFLGTNFMSVHLRRGDFFHHCLKGPGSLRKVPCYHPIRQLASCLSKKLKKHSSIGAVFLATNAEEMELVTLKEFLQYEGTGLPIVRLPKMVSQSWAEPLIQLGLQNEDEVVSLVDKTICSKSSVFLGTWGSTFTHDILRMRDWWQKGTACDTFICSPEDVADVLPMKNSTMMSS